MFGIEDFLMVKQVLLEYNSRFLIGPQSAAKNNEKNYVNVNCLGFIFECVANWREMGELGSNLTSTNNALQFHFI